PCSHDVTKRWGRGGETCQGSMDYIPLRWNEFKHGHIAVVLFRFEWDVQNGVFRKFIDDENDNHIRGKASNRSDIPRYRTILKCPHHLHDTTSVRCFKRQKGYERRSGGLSQKPQPSTE